MAHDCEPTGCFREEQQSRRIRPAPQDSPYLEYNSTTTSTTTTTTTKAPPPEELLDLISIPDSGFYLPCPALKDARPPMYFNAVGGDEVYFIPEMNNGIGRMVHKFYNDGIFSVQPYNEEIFDYAEMNILMVGGGGGGGTFDGSGGGGAGELKQTVYNFSSGPVEIVIGEGGDPSFNGKETKIVDYSIIAIGGGAGGESFEQDSAKTGGSGGGAGGRSNSVGAQAINGNNGGSSLGNVGGGGGGGAGSDGQSVPLIINNVSINAGAGGSGITLTFNNGLDYEDFAGGGAGDPFNNSIIGRSLGGGGGTINKNGIDGTGSGGAGNGGKGGKGVCIIYYTPVTTPPPVTTTTKAPEKPFIDSISCVGEWREIVSTITTNFSGTEIEYFTVDIYKNLVLISSIQYHVGMHDNISMIDENTWRISIPLLEDEQRYLVNITATNSVGVSNLVFCSSQTVTTTTTSTTTLPPDYTTFILEFDGNVTYVPNIETGIGDGYIGSDSVNIKGQEGTVRTAEVELIADSGVFYDKPSISLFGEGQGLINVDNISLSYSEDLKKINVTIPVTMPFVEEIKALVYFEASAVDVTTTSTTTTTTTLPPFCQSIYHTANFYLDEQQRWQHPTQDNRYLYPLQMFIARRAFPYEITGSSSPTSIVASSPWYNGRYFEIQRNLKDGESFVNSLPANYNELLVIRENPDGSQDLFDVDKYNLFYPNVSSNSISETYTRYILTDGSYRLYYTINIDYVCSVQNPLPYGKGSESISGFVNLLIKESTSLDNESVLVNEFIELSLFRKTGSFTSKLRGTYYSYMIDFGTRDRIVGQ